MKSFKILDELNELSLKNEISKKKLLNILKKYARNISAYDLMLASARMRKDGEYVQKQYREKFLKIYIENFLMRMKEVLDNEDELKGKINKKTFVESFPLLKTTFEKERRETYNNNDDKFPLIYVITSIYTTFILNEPIHPVGSEFPGSLKVESKNGTYYCPVKDNQKDNENAICHLCLAEQNPKI